MTDSESGPENGHPLDPGVLRDHGALPVRNLRSIAVPVEEAASAAMPEQAEKPQRPEPVLGVLTGSVGEPIVVTDPEDRNRLRKQMEAQIRGEVVAPPPKFEEQPTPPPSPEPEQPEPVDLTAPTPFPQPEVPEDAPQPQGGVTSAPRDPLAGWDA